MIYNADCMQFMSQMKNESVNLTLTDIPYDEVNKKKGCNQLRNLDKNKADVLTFNLDTFCNEVFRVTKGTIIIFCGYKQFSKIFSNLAEKFKRGAKTMHNEKNATEILLQALTSNSEDFVKIILEEKPTTHSPEYEIPLEKAFAKHFTAAEDGESLRALALVATLYLSTMHCGFPTRLLRASVGYLRENISLPTFNCNPIEMHLHRIPGLDEQFMYFNDDMFPVGKCSPEDFYSEGRPVIGYYRHLFATNMYKKICRNSDRLARKALGLKSSVFFTRPQHICSPMLKSECEALYNLAEDEIRRTSASRTRTAENLNQYLFLDYMNYKGLVINEKISNKHFSVSVASPAKLRSFLKNPDTDLVCINDVKLSESRYESLRDAVLEAFDSVFPEKSKYEI